MNMPRFTAEASLPKTREPYRMLRTLNPSASHGEVVPQLRLCQWECDDYTCWLNCHKGRVGGGPRLQ